MAAIVVSIDISRRPDDVFSYVADPSHQPEWNEHVVSARPEGDAPLAVGSRVLVTRRVGPWKLRYTEEMVELNPPRTWANRGVDVRQEHRGIAVIGSAQPRRHAGPPRTNPTSVRIGASAGFRASP